jgi:VWFA-related protein
VLHAALKRYAPNASSSVLLASPASTAPQAGSISMISAADPATASALDDFMKNEANFETNMRLLVTLDSLQTIARYLSGVPGRKNLIWFVGSFPLCSPIGDSVTSSGGCPFQDKVEKTVNMLAEARVSIYPIDAGGVSTPDSYQAETPNSGTGFLSQAEALRSENTTRGFQSINSATWAEKTGGKAYHTNDIKGEMAEAIDNGSRYYTVAYAPHSTEGLGRERRIEVRVPSGNYKLSYRRNYFELNRKELKAAGEAPAKDPLRPLMDRGMPSFTQLRYHLKVEPVTPQPLAGAAPAGDNPALKGPSTRYRLTFALEPGGLTLTPGPDGVRRGNIEVALIAYSQPGASLNWQLRSVGLAIRPEQMAIAENTGIPLHFDFDVPNGDVYLRTGIYDAESSRAGTLEIPLSAVKPLQPVAVKQVAGEHDTQAHLPPNDHSAVQKLQTVPKYHGQISVDPESGAITRLLLIADLEPGQLVSTADLFVEYSPIEIGGRTYSGRTYICPTRTGTLLVAKSIIEHGRQVNSGQTYLHATEEKLNITSISDSRFDQYHVFRSEMKIVGQ